MERKIKASYVVPEVLVVQLKTRSGLLLTESASGALSLEEGSFGARGSRFSDWNDFDEE